MLRRFGRVVATCPSYATIASKSRPFSSQVRKALVAKGFNQISLQTPVLRQLQFFHSSQPLLAQPGLPPAKPNELGILQYRLTDVGEGIAECELIRWFKKEGEAVEEFDRLCEVQSDKATVEITSRYAGTVTKLHYSVGDMAKVGAPLVDIKVAGWKAEPSAAAPAEEAKPERKQESNQERRPEEAARRELSVDGLLGKVLATPAVRHMARQNSIDLAAVPGTGRDGRIMRQDIVAYMKGDVAKEESTERTERTEPVKGGLAVSTPAASRGDEVVPIRGVKKIMVKTMTAAALVPHFGYKDEWNVDALIELRQKLKPSFESKGVKLTYMPIIIKACSLALLQYPDLNAHTNADCTEYIRRGSHNIGVAMDTPTGLIVPNVKNVQDKSIFEIASELKRMQQLGAEGKLTSADLTGGTFSLSNIGNIGGTYLFPVLSLPEVAIGALGKFQKLPRFDENGNVVAANIVNVSWSADHRVIDGATMARFSNLMKSYLEEPITMLTATK